MEKLFVKLPNGTFFKVHASKPVTVGLLGGNVGAEELDPGMREGPIPTCFYTCADGTYVGKEFIFIACQGLTGLQYRILALEESEVIVYKEDGTSQSFMLKANEYKDLSFTAFKAYKVASTGNVMVQSSYGYIPSVEGGYTGTSFYTKSTTSWYGYIAYGFQIIAAEEAKVTVYDVEFKRRIDEFVVPAQRNVTIKPKSNEIFIESDRPISVVYVSHGSPANYGASGLNYMGVSPDETAYVYIPLSSSQESYVFAYRDETVVTIGGAPIKLDADEFVPLSPGLHEVKTTENVLIQIVYSSNFPEIQSIRSFGTVVPAIETLDVRKDIELQPILEEETSMTTYIYASVAAAVIIAAAATYYLKSHK